MTLLVPLVTEYTTEIFNQQREQRLPKTCSVVSCHYTSSRTATVSDRKHMFKLEHVHPKELQRAAKALLKPYLPSAKSKAAPSKAKAAAAPDGVDGGDASLLVKAGLKALKSQIDEDAFEDNHADLRVTRVCVGVCGCVCDSVCMWGGVKCLL